MRLFIISMTKCYRISLFSKDLRNACLSAEIFAIALLYER
jgi:hypothetical protein